MRSRRSSIPLIASVFLGGCMGATECSCVAPSISVLGSVTGVAWPVNVDVRVGPSPCREDQTTSSSPSSTQTQPDGTYRVGVPLPAPGPACVIVTATKFADRPLTSVRRVEATITKQPLTGPQEIRVDVAFAP